MKKIKLCKNGGGFHILEISLITKNLYCPLCGEEKGKHKIEPQTIWECPFCYKNIPKGNKHYCHG